MTPHDIAKALGGEVTGPGRILAPGPGHSPRDRSLSITLDPAAPDGFTCHSFAGDPWQTCKDMVKDALGLDCRRDWQPPVRQDHVGAEFGLPALPDDDQARRVAYALRLWDEARPITPGCLAWRYFTEVRGLAIGALGDLSHALRWHRGVGAVVGLMSDPTTAEPSGVHRTFLYPDGARKGRRMLGKAGVVRLSPDDAVTLGLGLCEGVEDALAVLVSGWAPVWAATSAGQIARFPVLSGLDSLTIFSDGDAVGQEAANNCADRYRMAGIEARVSTFGAPAND